MKQSFSLIELLISLIIVSLLLAAFTPIIAKKLKASDITVGSFGNSGSNTITRNVTKEDCDELNAVYVEASEKVLKPLCVMKYNIGDGYYNDSWGGVRKCSAGENCDVENGTSTDVTVDNLTPACWVGTTGNTGCNDNYGGYSGCTRTVCNWTGADRMCANVGWRLPTIEELTAFTNTAYSNSTLASDGLMFCDNSNSSSSPVCTYPSERCLGTYTNYCFPGNVWSSSLSSTAAARYRDLNGQWSDNDRYLNYGFSVRCVLDGIAEEIKTSGSSSTDGETVAAEKPSEEFCANFDAMYIPAAMSGSTDLCVTKYNVGDVTATGSGPDIAENVVTLGIGASCTSSGFCCWQGKTSTTCTSTGNGNSTYSGCNRTVCQWAAAYTSCASWSPKGLPTGSWRLPTSSEYALWATNLDVLNKNQGTGGLQLCDNTSGYGSVQCGALTGSCITGNNNNCHAYRHWTQTPAGSNYYAFDYGSGALTQSAMSGSITGTARCVSSEVLNE